MSILKKAINSVLGYGNAPQVEEVSSETPLPPPLEVAESKEQAGKLPPIGRRFRKDTYVDEEVYDDLIAVKAKLLRDFPFWGILGLSLVLVEDESGQVPTLATDGRHIFYSKDFMNKLKRDEKMFAVAHELYHCVFEHAGKSHRGTFWGGIDPTVTDPEKIKEQQEKAQLWNFAVDFVVNDDLLQAGCGEFIRTIPILHDVKYRGWAAEEIYQHLLDNPKDRPQGMDTLDQHIEIEIVEDGEEGEGQGGSGGQGDKQQQDGKGPKKIRMTRSEYEKLRQQWQDNAVKAAAAQKEQDARSGGAGNIPAGIRRLLDDLTKPVYNWKQLLKRYVMSTMSRGYSFSQPNKPLFNNGFTIPGFRTRQQRLDIAIGVDTSGSISQEQLTEFISEMNGILKAFPMYNIKAWCFEGEVVPESVTEITKMNGRMDDITKFARNIGGGGGTSFEANWDFMKDEKLRPKLFLMLTDGMPFGGWGDPLYCPTMFLIVDNPTVDAPFGITMHYEDAQ